LYIVSRVCKSGCDTFGHMSATHVVAKGRFVAHGNMHVAIRDMFEQHASHADSLLRLAAHDNIHVAHSGLSLTPTCCSHMYPSVYEFVNMCPKIDKKHFGVNVQSERRKRSRREDVLVLMGSEVSII